MWVKSPQAGLGRVPPGRVREGEGRH